MLAAGTTLGPYRIIAPLGAGGMGEVYRAVDTRLGREVAVKVLPHHLSDNPEVRARFEREAKTVSSLNHPNICTLHDVGREGGTDYLVMELIEGETLGERLARGPLPIAEALRVGAQVAEALDRAHRAGVVHRDLKPGNVMLTKTGAKLMDFGLARGSAGMAGPVSGSGATFAALTKSPTVAAPLTAEGSIVGTFQYMSPEQLEGKESDARSDLWALGCVLYEMVTGRRAFEGQSQASLIGAIMTSDPPAISTLSPMSPPALERLVQHRLAKNPDDRWQTASDLRRQLLWIAESGSQSGARAVAPARRGTSVWIPAASVAAALLVGAFIGWRFLPAAGRAGSGAGASVRVTAMAQLTDLPGRQYSPSLSPDGKSLLYVAHDGTDTDIFLQRVGGENPINLTPNSDAQEYDPAFSPDGERIAFVSSREGGGIFVMGATGESPKKLVGEGAHPSWSPDGRRIVCSTERVGSPFGRNTVASLWVVDVATGEKKRIYAGDAVEPSWSPSGKRIAFWAADKGQRDVRTIPADGGAAVPVTADVPADWGPFWAPDGRALFFLSDRGGSRDLWRIAIDEGSGKVSGEPEPVTTGVARVMAGSISADGKRIAVTVEQGHSEILRSGFDPVAGRPLGTLVTLFNPSQELSQFSLSADGTWLAFRTGTAREDLFVMRADGTARRRLTEDEFRNRGPKWIRGNDWLVFYSNRGGNYQIWLIRSDGTEARPLTNHPEDVNQPAVSADGTRLAFSGNVNHKLGLVIVPVEDSWFAPGVSPTPVAVRIGAEGFIPQAWSPDGKSIVGYVSSPRGNLAATYTLATGRVEELPGENGSGSIGVTWLPDSRRMLGWDTRRDTAVLWDLVSRSAVDVPGIPGMSDLKLTADGRTLFIQRTITEGDIWMLTLR
jgi:eukaryotic-like serine/threonine-protein kinase